MENDIIDAANELASKGAHIRLMSLLVRFGYRKGEVGRELLDQLRNMPAYAHLFRPLEARE